MGTYHVLATCMLLYVSLTCNLMQNYYTQKKKKKKKKTTAAMVDNLAEKVDECPLNRGR